MVAVVLLILVLVLLSFRYFYYQQKKDMIEAEKRIEAKNQFQAELDKADMKKQQEGNRFSQVSAAELIKQKKEQFEPLEQASLESGVKMIPEYADQYDPNQDFAIFQVGNGATGGVMNLQEKMNVADNLNESSEEEDVAAQSTSVANKASSLANSNQPQAEFRSRPSSSNSSSNSEKRLTFDNFPMNQNLPEDQEVISELDEEEEEEC